VNSPLGMQTVKKSARHADLMRRFCAGRSAGLFTDVLAGHFAEALSRSEAQPWLQPKQRSFTSIPDYFQAVEEQISQNTTAADSLLQLQAAVASFLIFTQANLTG